VPVDQCTALAGQRLALRDAATRIDAAAVAPGGDGVPSFCEVTATIAPGIGIVLRLPATDWNGKFVEVGRGGYCRPVVMTECDNPLRKGFACIISDQGHKTAGSDDVWAADNLQAKVDCGFRGNHVAAVAGKAITQAYYRRALRHAYFIGCSTGGRMAMVEAQRFPHDFDGIVAGAPPVAKFYNGIALSWNALAALDPAGRPLLTADDLRLVHAAVLAKCDALDGLKDGIVGAALACRFDPAVVQCAPRQASASGGAVGACLTPAKVAAVRRIYAGPHDSAGRQLYDGAPLPGSELNWIGAYLPAGDQPSIILASMTEMFRYLQQPARGPDWSLSRLDWDSVSADVDLAEAYNGASNPDLSRFKAAGGRLILYHGLADQLIMPNSTIDYYRAVTRTMGGAAQTRDFARLFLVPGLGHCSGGDGATVIDPLAALDDWVEHRRAPDKLVGAHLRQPPANPYALVRLPLDPGDVAFTRPAYAYPATTRYAGHGDPAVATSFVAAN